MFRGNNSSPYKARTGTERPEDYYKNLYLAAEEERKLLQEEIVILRSKNKKVMEVQQNVDMVLQHNKKMLAQNEKLSKAVHQKKTQCEMWKNKFEALSATRMGQSNSHELQIKKLLNQIERLKEECAQIEHLKNLQINDIKNQSHLQIQNIKRSNMSTSQMAELEIRKLKDILDKKEYEIDQLNVRLNRAFNDSEFETIKLKEEKDRLRSEISLLEVQKRKEIQTLRLKLEHQHQAQIESMRKTNANHLQALQFQNLKLKDVIGSKNMEIENLIAKNQKMKLNYEETINILKRENEGLKQKYFETEKLSEVEIQTLKDKLQSLHDSQVQVLKKNHANLAEALQNQISKLESIITTKNQEIEQLLKEKSQARLSFEAELARVRNEVDVMKIKNNQLQNSYGKDLSDLTQKIKSRDNRIDQLEEHARNDRQKFNEEIGNLRDLFEKKTRELDQLNLLSSKQIRNLEHQNNMLNKKVKDAQTEVEAQRKVSGGDVQKVKEEMQKQSKRFNTKLECVNTELNATKAQVGNLQKLCAGKEEEIHTLERRNKGQEQRQKKLKKQLDELKQLMTNAQKKHTQNLDDMKRRLEDSYKFNLTSLGKENQNTVTVLQLNIKQLTSQLNFRSKELEELLKKYKALEEKFYELSQQESNKRQLDIKFAGALPQILATKNIFDVYLKTKVLDFCGK